MRGEKKTNGTDDFYSIETIDGVTIWMKRYKPNKGKISSYPVILCHGLLANKHSLDFGDKNYDNEIWEKYSLASYLYNGAFDNNIRYDVWVPELRGRRSYSEYDFAKRGQIPEEKHWCFDDYVDKDVPAIIECVKKTYAEEGKPDTPVFWIGMSMGGMLAYAHGQTDRGHRDFKGVVTIGSPATFEYTKSIFRKFKGIAPRNMFIRINLRSILENNPDFKIIFVNNAIETGNISSEIAEKYLEMGFDNSVSSKILSHFGIFYRHNNFTRYPKCPWAYDILDTVPGICRCVEPYSWKKNLHIFNTPILAVAGGADEEAPPKEVKSVLSCLGSTEITYLELSKQSGNHKDYSHLDFHLAEHVRDEFYVFVYKWLTDHS